MREAKTWAHLHPQRGWCRSSTHKKVAELLWEGDPVRRVLVREDPGGDHLAWWDNAKGCFEYLNKNSNMVRMCFPYGPEAEEARGRGELLVVSVQEIADGLV